MERIITHSLEEEVADNFHRAVEAFAKDKFQRDEILRAAGFCMEHAVGEPKTTGSGPIPPYAPHPSGLLQDA